MLFLMRTMALDNDDFGMRLGHRLRSGLERGEQLGPRVKLGDNPRGVSLDDSLHPAILDIVDLDRQIDDPLAQERKHALGAANS